MHIYTHDIDTIVIDYERQCMNGVIKIPYRGIFPGKNVSRKSPFNLFARKNLLTDHY